MKQKNRHAAVKSGLCGVLAAVLLGALLALPAAADDTPGQGRTVRIACGANDTLYLAENGDPAGSCLPYVRQLAWNQNWTLEYVPGSYNESLENLRTGKVDLMFPVSAEDGAGGGLAYSDAIAGYQQIGLFAKSDAEIYCDDYEGFDGCRVGLSLGSNSEIVDAFAAEHDFAYTAVPLNSVQDKVSALMNGEVELVAFSTLNAVPGGKLVAVLQQVPVYFCTAADNTELMAEVNTSMAVSMVNTPDIVTDLYQNLLKGSTTTSFTRQETEKIQSTEKVVFGVYSDCLPLAGVDAKGNCVGIYVDTLKEIAARSGLNIEVKPIKDSNRLYGYLDDGTVDFVIGLQELRFSMANAENHLASNGIADYTTVAVSMPDYQFDGDESPAFALTKARDFLEDYIYTNFPAATIQYYDTRKECLNAVQRGAADATFMNTWEYNYETKNPRFQEMMEWESMRIVSVFGLGGTRQSDLELLSILEKTISQIPAERMNEIIAANLNMPYQSYDLADRFYEVKTELTVALAVLAVLAGGLGIYWGVKRRYIRGLETANRAKADFLSRMSHELRTPLNAINGYAALTAQNLQEGTGSRADMRENMTSIQKASDYLLGIIKDILDVQRMETGRVTLEKSTVDPNEYMDNVVKMLRPAADEKKIEFTYTMLSGGEYDYELDPLRLQQVLFNILYNAVKFTPEGGRVAMTSELSEKTDSTATIRIVIADTGIGMSKEFMQTRLFHKFAQENQDITSPYSGCGNGLAICKELVELMDGAISCESEQGVGTTFTVTIKAECRLRAPQKPAQKPAGRYDLGGLHVLICEDNPMNQDIERRLLERMNCVVEIAADGKIGLEKFAQSPAGGCDVILMDIRMPGMDGLEAAAAIRALERPDAKTVPIIAVSANAFPEDVQKSLDAGMNEHLAKPVDGRVLFAKIREYCPPKPEA